MCWKINFGESFTGSQSYMNFYTVTVLDPNSFGVALFNISAGINGHTLSFPHIESHKHCSLLWMIAVINGYLRGPCWWRAMQQTPTLWSFFCWRLPVRKRVWQLYCRVTGVERAGWRVWDGSQWLCLTLDNISNDGALAGVDPQLSQLEDLQIQVSS